MPRAERREQLLEVAQQIVEGEGVGALTMSALAERAGASKPVVYEHFENSEAVAVAVLERNLDDLVAFVLERVENAADIYAYMDLAIDAQFDFHNRHGLITRNITSGASSSEIVNRAYLDRRQMAIYVFQGLLEQQGVPRSRSVVAAHALSEMIGAIVFDFARGKASSAARETLKTMVGGLIRSLGPTPGPKPHTPSISDFRKRQGRQAGA